MDGGDADAAADGSMEVEAPAEGVATAPPAEAQEAEAGAADPAENGAMEVDEAKGKDGAAAAEAERLRQLKRRMGGSGTLRPWDRAYLMGAAKVRPRVPCTRVCRLMGAGSMGGK